MLSVENVYMVYEDFEAVKGVSFNVRPGEIYGLIGPNGAGKTTLIRMIVGLLRPTRGRITVFGLDPYRDFEKTRKLIGYLPEEAGTYPFLTGREHLEIFARLYSQGRDEYEEMVKYGAEISGLGDRLDDLTIEYSHGMKRRILLAVALMKKPKLAVLDEPTSGLDVLAGVRVRQLIRRYVEETGAAVLLSSHNMLEIEYLCDRVGLIYRGRLLVEGPPQALLREHGARNLEELFTSLVAEEAEVHE